MNVLWQETLTPREQAVFAEAQSGATTAEIAARLFVSPSTVKTHLSSIYLKANAVSRAGALAGSIDPETHHLTRLPLTPRQRDVVRCLLRGDSNREIATTLCLSPETVKDHLEKISDVLGLRNRYEIVAVAVRDTTSAAA